VPEEPPNLRTKLVEDVWKMFEGFGVPLDVSHYNALLRVYLENEHSFDPMKFIKILEGKSIEPNRVIFLSQNSFYFC
jgi:leucine-rich PPR motif-containing protein